VKIPFTIHAVSEVTHTLTPAKRHRLLRLLGRTEERLDDGNIELTPAQALVLWTADALMVRTALPLDQQDFLLEELHRTIADIGRRIWLTLEKFEEKDERGDVITAHLMLWDSRFVSVSGKSGYLDLQKAVWLTKLDRAPLWTQSCDLTTLFISYRARMAKLHPGRRDTDAERIPAA
jgi:hypothetical protein